MGVIAILMLLAFSFASCSPSFSHDARIAHMRERYSLF